MVGGKVIGVQHASDHVRLLVRGHGRDSHMESVRKVHPTSRARAVRPGDTVWWQGELILWSSDDLRVCDVHLASFRKDFLGRVYLTEPVARVAAGWPADRRVLETNPERNINS